MVSPAGGDSDVSADRGEMRTDVRKLLDRVAVRGAGMRGQFERRCSGTPTARRGCRHSMAGRR